MNEPAKIVFDILVKRIKDKQVDPHHSQHIIISDKKDIITADDYISSKTDKSNDLESNINNSTYYISFYCIDFDTSLLLQGSQ